MADRGRDKTAGLTPLFFYTVVVAVIVVTVVGVLTNNIIPTKQLRLVRTQTAGEYFFPLLVSPPPT